MTPKFFRAPAQLRRWLQGHHGRAAELLVGFHKRGSGRPSLTWPQSVDEALCFGWIDGVRRRIDADSYCIRFTPRRRSSIWSAVNVARMQALIAQRRVAPAGHEAFAVRRARRTGRYSYEQRPTRLPAAYAKVLRRDPAAQAFFARQIPSYRRAAIWWVVSAKRAETRAARALRLVALSRQQLLIPQFIRRPAGTERRR
jgi:uncharacterized protein YdeI (YjbR/CyaY-like superfamily)